MGFAAGFQVGAQAVERGLKMRDENELKARLAEVYNAPTSDFNYTSDQMERMRQAQTSGAYDIEAVPGAEGQTPTLRYIPKQGLDAGDAAAIRPMEFAPQQVQRYGDQTIAGQFSPEKLQGLQMRRAAQVVGASGDPVRAAQLLAEANRLDREAVEAPLRLKGLQQQVETGDLTLAEKRRSAEDAQRMSNFGNAYAEANAQALAENRTLSANEIANLAKQNKLTFAQENEVIGAHVKRATAEVEQFRLDVEKATQGKGFEQLIDLHKNDKRFGDGVHFVPEVDKKTGKVVLARVNEATGQVEDRMSFKTKAEATAYLREEAVNPANAAIWLQNYKKGETGIEANQAQIRASDSTVSLNAAKAEQTRMQSNILKMNVENNAEARNLQLELGKLDDESDPTGSKRANLIAQFNMLTVGPGKTIPMGGGSSKAAAKSILKQPVEQKKNDDGTYTAFSKDGGQALYNTFNGEAIPLGMTVTEFQAMKDAAKKNGVELYRVEDDGKLGLGFVGPDGKPYSDPEKAKRSKAPAPEKEATSAPAAKTGIDTSRSSRVAPSSDEAPPVKKSVSYGATLYTIPGISGTFKSEQAAKAAWADKNKNKLSFRD